jgi:hypothetical protein
MVQSGGLDLNRQIYLPPVESEIISCSEYDEESCQDPEREGLCLYNNIENKCEQSNCTKEYKDNLEECVKNTNCEVDEYKKDNHGNIISGSGVCKNKNKTIQNWGKNNTVFY